MSEHVIVTLCAALFSIALYCLERYVINRRAKLEEENADRVRKYEENRAEEIQILALGIDRPEFFEEEPVEALEPFRAACFSMSTDKIKETWPDFTPELVELHFRYGVRLFFMSELHGCNCDYPNRNINCPAGGYCKVLELEKAKKRNA